MQRRRSLALLRQLLLLSLAGSRWLHRAGATGIVSFDMAPTSGGGCTAATSVVAAASVLECATRCSLNDAWLSFSFIPDSGGGVCVLSGSPSCATEEAATLFRKRIAAPYAGFEMAVGARRFWVFQQRKTGLVSFARNWTDYERGFGDVSDFWSGLAAISGLMSPTGRTLRMEMLTFDGLLFASEWSNFSVSNASTNYTMTYATYVTASSNTTGDCLRHHLNMKFSTIDRDNDLATNSCSQSCGGAGFWFNNCLYMNPNGLYSASNQSNNQIYMSCMEAQNYRTLRETRIMLQV